MDARTAAIALTLIVAAPILLGYALAFTEETVTVYSTSEQTNVTDMILNHNTPYYVSSKAPGNNQQILMRVTYSGGVNETNIWAPDYIVESSKYTSLPTTETVTQSVALNTYHSSTTTGTDHGTYTQITYNDEIPAGKGYYKLQSDQLCEFHYNGGLTSRMGYSWDLYQDSASSWEFEDYGQSFYADTDMYIVSDRSPTYTITYADWFTMGDYAASWSTTISSVRTMKITDTSLNVTYYPCYANNVVLLKVGTTLYMTIGSGSTRTITNVSAIDVCSLTNQSLSIQYTQPSGNYADPAYGWAIPEPTSYIAVYPYWVNGQLNESVRMMVKLDVGDYTDIQPMYQNTVGTTISLRHPNSTGITVNGDLLGAYDYVCIEFSQTGAKVSGLMTWPTMGAEPSRMNTIDVDYTNDLTYIDRIYLSDPFSCQYRVDNAEILAGTFPSTLNKTLNLSAYYPNQDYAISITSAGVFGDSISWGGESYTVTNGSITTGRLLQSVFSTTYDESNSEWVNSINGKEISRTASPATMYLGGEWSITLSSYSMTETTGTQMTWHPGEFAFNGMDSDFALFGLAASIAVFIALGLYGRRSGAKVGALMLICGCAGIIFLLMM